MTIHRYYVTAPRGLVGLLREELEELGAGSVKVEPGGCRVRGPLSFGYRICMGSRCAARVLLGLSEVAIENADELYAAVREIAWEDHVRADGTLAVDFVGAGAGIDNTNFGGQRVKDAIVDRFREREGTRPSVDRESPDLRVNVFLRGRGCALSVDLSGGSLHRRGYREAAVAAPMKENLAAGLLRFAGFQGGPLVDPVCGGGTLVIEAAMIATDRAPGLVRERFGFENWLGHDPDAWSETKAEAEAAIRPLSTAQFFGYDHNAAAIAAARQAASRAGVAEATSFEVRALRAVEAPGNAEGPGLVVANPPFGERLGDKDRARQTFAQLGTRLRSAFEGWRFAVIASDDDLLSALGCVPEATTPVMSGPIEARIALGKVTQPAGDLVNRLRKNLKHLGKWRRREAVTCFRLYDADLPEYNAAIDVYGDHVVVAEYEAPAHIDADRAAARRIEIAAAAAAVLEAPTDLVHLKTRRRQKGSAQYERIADDGVSIVVEEAGHRFRVDLSDHLDTGLFLDHRLTRRVVGEHANGARVLNLFAYTGTASVYAAKAGAKTTTTVDLSKNYLAWAEENFALNGIQGGHHRFVRADALRFVEQDHGTYDLIFLDPPTFSNSKSMRETFDVQRDHLALIQAVRSRLAADGTLIFSTNARRFALDDAVATHFDVEEITKKTTPPDFSRRRPHQAWILRPREKPKSS